MSDTDIEREALFAIIERQRRALIAVASDLGHSNPQAESALRVAREALEVVPYANRAQPPESAA